MDSNREVTNEFIDERLKNRPMSLEVFETEIMDFLGIEGDYFTLDESNSKKVNDLKNAVLRDPRIIQKEIRSEEETEDNPFINPMWVTHKDTPPSVIKKTVREWNADILNDPDLDWDPFNPGKEELK